MTTAATIHISRGSSTTPRPGKRTAPEQAAHAPRPTGQEQEQPGDCGQHEQEQPVRKTRWRGQEG